MPVIDYLFAIAPVRKVIWRLWYPFLTRRLREDDVLFLNYAFEEDPSVNLPLSACDALDRASIQLYHHVATQVELTEKNVLEVSCGHGGGASYLTRTLQPEHYTALDLNAAGIAFCRQRHATVERLSFVQGDAENLPFEPDTFDVVINIEASHCYPDFHQFLAQVARVLRSGGFFLYADFRFSDGIASWDQALAAAPLENIRRRNINAEVLRGMKRNSDRSMNLIRRQLPGMFHPLGRDFAGVEGSRIYEALRRGELSYRSYCFQKPLR